MFLRSLPLCYRCFGGFALAYSQSDCLTEHPHCAHGSEMAQKMLLVQTHSLLQQTPGTVYFPFEGF